jgi:hypothetical protein
MEFSLFNIRNKNTVNNETKLLTAIQFCREVSIEKSTSNYCKVIEIVVPCSLESAKDQC